jgi:undecaprenyl diphosphate synthase
LGKKQSQSDKELQEKLKRSGNIPNHIAIIMDGNGRWAKERGLPRVSGHRAGVETVRDIVESCSQLGVNYLTLYTFSTENWKRPRKEVSTLMRLLLRNLKDRVDELHKNDVKLTCIGDINSLPEEVQKQLFDDIERTKNNKGLTLNLALSYSGRWELIEAVKRISNLVREGKLNPDELTEQCVSENLTTSEVVRTSGEFRVSNFLLWQIAYSEFYITEVYWPDFKRNRLYEAIESFQKRERRFGKVSEQIKKKRKGVENAQRLPTEAI